MQTWCIYRLDSRQKNRYAPNIALDGAPVANGNADVIVHKKQERSHSEPFLPPISKNGSIGVHFSKTKFYFTHNSSLVYSFISSLSPVSPRPNTELQSRRYRLTDTDESIRPQTSTVLTDESVQPQTSTVLTDENTDGDRNSGSGRNLYQSMGTALVCHDCRIDGKIF